MKETPPSGVVTFVFTDIEGSTSLLRSVGDAYGDILEEHHRLIRAAITSHHGFEENTGGDGFLVAFDDASDAIATALEIQRAVSTHPWREGVAVKVRIGVHRGEASVVADEYVSLALHQTARIVAAAHGGEILVSDDVASVVRGGLPQGSSLVALGQFRVRDFDGPVELHRLEHRDLPSVRHAPRIPSAASPFVDVSPQEDRVFVGRDTQLHLLSDAWLNVSTARRGTVLVRGEAGIGKTRLVREFARAVAADGHIVMFGRCDEQVAKPYQPFSEALSTFIEPMAREDAEELLDVGALHPMLRTKTTVASARVPNSGDPETDRYALFEAVDQALSRIGERHPVLLVLDDIHWAESSTAMLLRHVVRSPRSARLLIVGTLRDVADETHPLSGLLVDAHRDSTVVQIALGGFDETTVASLLEQRSGDIPNPKFVQALARETRGNPFFIGEIVRASATSGLDLTAGEWVLPTSVRDVLRNRFNAVSADCRRLLQATSVIGAEFDVQLATEIAGLTPDSTFYAIDEALAAGLLEEHRDVRGLKLDFSHPLIRRVLYDDRSQLRREHDHAVVAAAIERSFSDDLDSYVSSLAQHFRLAGAAGDHDKAFRYAVRAADAAARGFAWEEAAEHLDVAISLLSGDADAERALLLDRHARLMLTTGIDLELGAQRFESAIELYERAGDELRAANARSRLGFMQSSYIQTMDITSARANLDKARTVQEREEKASPLASTLLALASAEMFGGSVDLGVAYSEEAREIAQRIGDVSALVQADVRLGWFRFQAGHLHSGLSLLDDACATAEAEQLRTVAWVANWVRIGTRFLLLDFDEALVLIARELDKPGHVPGARRALANMGVIAEVSVGRTPVAAVRAEAVDVSLMGFELRAFIEYTAGRFASGVESGEAARLTFASKGSRLDATFASWWIARCLMELGDVGTAAASVEAGLAGAVETGCVVNESLARVLSAYSLIDRGARKDAASQLARLTEITSNGEDWRGIGDLASGVQSLLALCEGNSESALERLTSADEALRDAGAGWFRAELLRRCARISASEGETRVSIDLFNRARAAYRDVNAGEEWQRQVDAESAAV